MCLPRDVNHDTLTPLNLVCAGRPRAYSFSILGRPGPFAAAATIGLQHSRRRCCLRRCQHTPPLCRKPGCQPSPCQGASPFTVSIYLSLRSKAPSLVRARAVALSLCLCAAQKIFLCLCAARKRRSGGLASRNKHFAPNTYGKQSGPSEGNMRAWLCSASPRPRS